MSAKRTCGDCQACCVVLGIREFEKPAFQVCPNQCKSGCKVYDERPASCRAYNCLWLDAGLGKRKDRPDRLGMVVDVIAPANVDELTPEQLEQARKRVRAREIVPGAFGRKRVKGLLKGLYAAGCTVQLIPFNGRRLPVGKPL